MFHFKGCLEQIDQVLRFLDAELGRDGEFSPHELALAGRHG
jgi:uncharacterized OsmC-like protein